MIIDTMKLENCYDQLLQMLVPKTSWLDWLFIKAIIKQESAFNPVAQSSVGARGLGQIMPATDEWLDGVMDGFDIYGNLKNTVQMVNFLHDLLLKKGLTPPDSLPFILAAYNAGPGNLEKAMSLAQLANANPMVWSEVAPFLQDITGPRSSETLQYVTAVLGNYKQYKGGG